MRIMTVIGTRPEIIRLSIIMRKLDYLARDKICSKHIIVHTGQNYSSSLSDVFFRELEIREPDYYLGVKENRFGRQLGQILSRVEEVLIQERPDRVLILGDTNSCLSVIIAERMGIPVFHMEAGNRCFDTRVPEENNRKIIDAIASYNLPYTPGSRENLLTAGCQKNRVFLTGNPIYEVLNYYQEKIDNSNVLENLQLKKNNYILATIHRAENVDFADRLTIIIKAINKIQQETGQKIIFSVHPRTREKIKEFKLISVNDDIHYSEPFGFFDFVKLEKNAALVLTDSGTVQEECCLFHVPTVTIRDSTERPETVECGSNTVSGINYEHILSSARNSYKHDRNWEYPDGYLEKNVSDKVISFLLSN